MLRSLCRRAFSSSPSARITVEPITGVMGAEISGVDLTVRLRLFVCAISVDADGDSVFTPNHVQVFTVSRLPPPLRSRTFELRCCNGAWSSSVTNQ